MGFMDKIKEFVQPDDEEFEEEEVTVTEGAVANPAPAAAQPQKSTYEKKSGGAAPLDANTKMVLFEPRSFGEAEQVGQRLKEGRAVVVNLHKLDANYSQRTIDFLSGVVFALDGNIQRIGQNVILCYPSSIGVAGSINLGAVNDAETAAE